MSNSQGTERSQVIIGKASLSGEVRVFGVIDSHVQGNCSDNRGLWQVPSVEWASRVKSRSSESESGSSAATQATLVGLPSPTDDKWDHQTELVHPVAAEFAEDIDPITGQDAFRQQDDFIPLWLAKTTAV